MRFKPSANFGSTAGFGEDLTIEVTGVIVQIHAAHRWYRAAYETPQGTRYECFKF